MDKYIGKMLDNRYEIIELIGSGGMANVYRAKCHRLNRMVAIKILKTDMAEMRRYAAASGMRARLWRSFPTPISCPFMMSPPAVTQSILSWSSSTALP